MFLISPLLIRSLPPVAQFWATTTENDETTETTTSTTVSVPPRTTTRRRPSPTLAPGVHDLVAAVVDVLSLPDDARTRAIRILDNGFVRTQHMQHEWAILWVVRPATNITVIPTRLDVEQDPIIARLREWIRHALLLLPDNGDDTWPPPPMYPVDDADATDPRPDEPIPPELQPLDPPDVWPIVEAAGLSLICGRWKSAYLTGSNGGVVVMAAGSPVPERLRQWRQLSEAHEELTFRQMVECLGWHTQLSPHDTQVVQLLTARFLGQTVPVATWYLQRGSKHLWRWRMCLREMRLAVVVVSRLRLGHADLSCLVRDLRG